jgi:hypothetical protein
MQWVATHSPSLTLAFSDPAGLSTVAYAIGTGTYSTPVAYATTLAVSIPSDGVTTVWLRVTDVAGNAGVYSISLGVDTTGPVISNSLSAPQSATYGYDGTADISYSVSASDAGSGVATVTVKVDSTAVSGGSIDVDKFTAGSHTVTFTAVDAVGNTSTVTVTISIHPSRAGLGQAVNEGVAAGSITSAEGTKLLSLLNSTSNTLVTDVTNFNNEVKAQTGKAISTAEASILSSWGSDLLARAKAGTATARDIAVSAKRPASTATKKAVAERKKIAKRGKRKKIAKRKAAGKKKSPKPKAAAPKKVGVKG